MAIATIKICNEQATRMLGARLAQLLRAGDIVLLEGPLGAGKTSLARSVIQTLTGARDVPSPTYTLVETYETDAFSLWHFDLYRLKKPEEIWELGLEECLDGGAALIEWPDRARQLLRDDALTISIKLDGNGRIFEFVGPPAWRERLHEAGIA